MTQAQLWERYMYFTHLEARLASEGRLDEMRERARREWEGDWFERSSYA
jgi:hypothetical protein